MTVTLKKWYLPFDELGTAPTNLITLEEHTLQDAAIKLLQPKFGNYYKQSLVIEQKTPGNIWVVVDKSKYNCAEINLKATINSGKEVCKYVFITDSSVSNDIRLTYQALGGPDQFNAGALIDNVNAVLDDVHTIKYSDILGRPRMFKPKPHKEDARNLYGLEYIVAALNRLHYAINIKELSYMYLHDEVFKYMHRSFKEFTDVFGNNMSKNLNENLSARVPNLNTATNDLNIAYETLSTSVFYTNWAKSVFDMWWGIMKYKAVDIDYYWSAVHNEPLASAAIRKMRNAGAYNVGTHTALNYSNWKSAAGNVISNIGGCVYQSDVKNYNATTKLLPAVVSTKTALTSAGVSKSTVTHATVGVVATYLSKASPIDASFSTPITASKEYSVLFVGAILKGSIVDLSVGVQLICDLTIGVKLGVYNKVTQTLDVLVRCQQSAVAKPLVFCVSSSNSKGFTNVFVEELGLACYTSPLQQLPVDLYMTGVLETDGYAQSLNQEFYHLSVYSKALSQIEISCILEYVRRNEYHYDCPAVPFLSAKFNF